MNPSLRRAAIVLAATALSISAAGQDVMIGPPVMLPGQSPSGGMPGLKSPPKIHCPDEMADSSEIGYALVQLVATPPGKWSFSVTATHVPFARAVSGAVGKWEVVPPPSEGMRVPTAWIPVIFNPESANPKQHEATPRLLGVTPLIVPKAFLTHWDGPPVVRVRVALDPAGKVTDITFVRPTDGRLLPVLRTELAQWRFAPARDHDRPVAGTTEVSVLLLTNQPSRYRFFSVPAPEPGASRPAMATLKTLALYPRDVPAAGQDPDVTVDFTVDVEGEVHDIVIQDSKDPRLNDAALAAVRAWKFTPCLKQGEPVAEQKRLRVDFMSEVQLQAVAAPDKFVPPKPIKRDPPVYPVEMVRSGISGEVTVDFVVDTQGNVKNAVVTKSNNLGFEAPALQAIRRWKFEPATRNGKPFETHMQVPIILQMDSVGQERRELVQATAPDAAAMKKLPPEFRYDTPPRFVNLVRPVYPYRLQQDGVTGKAWVQFVVDRQGQVALIEIKEASRPEFGLALAAAVEAARFEPALRDGQPTQAIMRREQDFDFGQDNQLLLDRDERLLGWEKKRPERILSGDKLDAPLKPIVRRAPEFPLRLAKAVEQGDAEVEFLIDEDGHARLPRVVSASEPEFGYSAVQAIALWAFEPPRANGKTVVVRVRQPFHFGPARAPRSTPAAAAP